MEVGANGNSPNTLAKFKTLSKSLFDSSDQSDSSDKPYK